MRASDTITGSFAMSLFLCRSLSLSHLHSNGGSGTRIRRVCVSVCVSDIMKIEQLKMFRMFADNKEIIISICIEAMSRV